MKQADIGTWAWIDSFELGYEYECVKCGYTILVPTKMTSDIKKCPCCEKGGK